MSKWYKKYYYVVTRKNFVSVFMWIFGIFFFFLENITGADRGFSLFFIGLAMGQEIGYHIAKLKYKGK